MNSRLIRNPPNKKPPLGGEKKELGGKNMFTIDLDGGTISPLIKYPPSETNIVTMNLDGGTIN